MCVNYLKYFVALLLLGMTSSSVSSAAEIKLAVDWKEYMSHQDLVWDRLPTNYFEGAYVGNGLLGTILYQDVPLTNSLRFEIGRTDVAEHRDAIQFKKDTQHGYRLPIGQLLLTPVGKIIQTHLRTDLWNAEITGDLTTNAGTIHLRCFTPSNENVIIIEISTSYGEEAAKFSFRPEQALNPRHLAQPDRDPNYFETPNPPFRVERTQNMEVCVQPLLAGSDYATAWKEVESTQNKKTVYVTVANRRITTGSAADAVITIQKAIARGVPAMEKAHRDWWHAFYQASFVSVPDKRLESFYWIQLYKLASATRENQPVVDLMGPWFQPTVWAAYWLNLNMELSYYPVLPENHPELGNGLCRLLEKNVQNFIHNCPPNMQEDSAAVGGIVGYYGMIAPAPLSDALNGYLPTAGKKSGYHFLCLPWLLQQFYLQYRYTMDDQRLRDSLYPILRRTFNVYLHVVFLGPDGHYHIPMAFSDEYGYAEDTSMNLAVVRWGLQTLIQSSERLKINDPLLPEWREVLNKLVDYPIDENGIMVGKDLPFSKPHRHYSHLFAIFPFHVLNVEHQPDRRPLMEKSIQHFLSLNGDDCMFKFTGASSLYAAIGEGDNALKWLKKATTIQPTGPTITPNTLYSENGWQTFESPESASRDILDMLIQSWGDSIHVFPACPSTWKDVSFYNLRAQGAFLVSAVRKDGVTRFIRIKSLAGEPCRVRCDLPSPIRVLGSSTTLLQKHDGLLHLNLVKNKEIILYSGNVPPDLKIEPVSMSPNDNNAWGLQTVFKQ